MLARPGWAGGVAGDSPAQRNRGEQMEHRECQNCGVRTQQERIDLTAQAVSWTVFICSECRTMVRARRTRIWAPVG